MACQDALLSKFEADFNQQQSEMTNKIDTFLKAINDRMIGALPSDTVKNPKLNVHLTSSVSSARCYPMEDLQISPCPLNPVNAIKTCFKPPNDFQKVQLQVKTLTVNKSGTSKPKEHKKALEDKFKNLHLELPVLEVLAHAPIYNAILDKYVESLELGKNGFAFIQGEMPKKIKDPRLITLPCRLGDSKSFDTLADLGSGVNLIPLYLFKKLQIRLLEETDHVFRLEDGTKLYPVGIVRNVEVHIGKLKILGDFYVIDMENDPTYPLLVGRGFLATAIVVIDFRKAKIAVEKGITRSIFRVKEINIGDKDVPYWTTLGKRESYEPQPSTNGIDAQPPYYANKDFITYHLLGEWEIARDAELNPIKYVLVFRKMVEFLEAIPINLKGNIWESEELIEKKIDWNKPPKEVDDVWHISIELIDPDGEKFNTTFQSIPTTMKLFEKENPSEIIDLEHFYDY
ncbi:MAK10-like protein [Tanacetum coccineum]